MNEPYAIELFTRVDENGSLMVFEEGTVPFPVVRTFVVRAHAGQVRGQHAHRECTQMLAVLQGQVLVTINDGQSTHEYLLRTSEEGLVIPPMLWATQKYLTDDSVLLVACDRLFDESDYIRSAEDFAGLAPPSQIT